eukprot:tig00001017_g6251.t1
MALFCSSAPALVSARGLAWRADVRHALPASTLPQARRHHAATFEAGPSVPVLRAAADGAPHRSLRPIQPSFHHVSIMTADTQRSVDFYTMLGFYVMDSRPSTIKYNGAWLGTPDNSGLSIHLIEMPNVDPTEGRPAYVGEDRHTAFAIPDLDALVEVLLEEGVPHRLSGSGRRACFFRDPDGNGLEFIEVHPGPQ